MVGFFMIKEIFREILSFRLNKESVRLIVLLTITGVISNWLVFCFHQFKVGITYCFSFPPNYDIFPLSPAAVKLAAWAIIFLLVRQLLTKK